MMAVGRANSVSVGCAIKLTVSRNPDQVFDKLSDLELLIRSVPGARLTRRLEGGSFAGELAIGLGKFAIHYSGSGRVLEYHSSARRASMLVNGHGVAGIGQATARMRLAVDPWGQGSLIRASVTITVAGNAARFGARLISRVAQELMADAAVGLKAELEESARSTTGGRRNPNT